MIDLKQLKEETLGMGILLVEDELSLSAAIEVSLKLLFQHTQASANGNDALEKYKMHHYDIVITDINLPGMNGIDLIKAIRSINPEQLIIVLTAHNEKYILDTLRLLRVDIIISKPLLPNKLKEVLHEAVLKLKATKN